MNEDGTLYSRDDIAKGPGKRVLRIDQTQCLNLRGRHVSCTQCADTCSAMALALTADEVCLDAERCTACGACLPVCPSGAMLLTGFDPRQLLETVTGTAEVHIRCSQSDHADVGNIVPCLQVLDTRLLAAAAADGAQTVVLHGTDQCSSCARGDARATVEQMYVNLKKWFTDVPLDLVQDEGTLTETGVQLGEEQVDLGRRNFLGFAGGQSAHGASKRFTGVAPQKAEATPRWPVLSNDGKTCYPSIYQELLAERAGSLPWREHQLPWYSRTFSDACSACLACAQHCPTGALVAEETKSTISIWFHLRLCTDCGLCTDLCPENAISCAPVTGPAALSAPAHRMMYRNLHKCTGCARSFVLGENSGELCMTCQNEYDIDNDWKAMLTKSSYE